MARIKIKPIPLGWRKIPKRLRPGLPPIFDGVPTREDIALAIELIEALDPESAEWYARSLAELRARLADA